MISIAVEFILNVGLLFFYREERLNIECFLYIESKGDCAEILEIWKPGCCWIQGTPIPCKFASFFQVKKEKKMYKYLN